MLLKRQKLFPHQFKMNADKRSMKKAFFIFSFFIAASLSFALDLTISESDTYVLQNPDGGYDLYIRKKPDIASVLITESTKDVTNEEANYAFRSPYFNPINGYEKRMLNGEFLPEENKIYSLIDSTPEANARFGQAFHIWIPYIVEFGYSGTRHGEVQVLDGTFLNIRSFEKPYADYSGAFAENPFLLRVTQEPIKFEGTQAKYMDGAVESFDALAKDSQGMLQYASGPHDIVPHIEIPLKQKEKENMQVAFVIDATASMRDDIAMVRKSIIPLIEKYAPQYKRFELALVLYKDYSDDFLTKRICNFTETTSRFYNGLRNFDVRGGKDIPEAVYEGINEALRLNWNDDENTKRLIILIGDAPPHPIPRGNVTKDTVTNSANAKGIAIYPIILPHEVTK